MFLSSKFDLRSDFQHSSMFMGNRCYLYHYRGVKILPEELMTVINMSCFRNGREDEVMAQQMILAVPSSEIHKGYH